MKKIIGRPGTVCGLLLRIGQCTSAAASMVVMLSAKDFYKRTAFSYVFSFLLSLDSVMLAQMSDFKLRKKLTSFGFSYLIASMCLQMLWSFWLACVNVYALRYKKDLQHLTAVSLFIGGDLVQKLLLVGLSKSLQTVELFSC